MPLCYLFTVELHPIKEEQSNKEGLYWKVDFPFPMSDRDVSNHLSKRLVYTLFVSVGPLDCG